MKAERLVILRRDAATAIFNRPDYRVTDTKAISRAAAVSVEATAEAGCPDCGCDQHPGTFTLTPNAAGMTVVGPIGLVSSERRFYCDEQLCLRRTFVEEIAQVCRRARSTRRLWDSYQRWSSIREGLPGRQHLPSVSHDGWSSGHWIPWS